MPNQLLEVTTYFVGWSVYWCSQCYRNLCYHRNVCSRFDLCWTEQLQAHQRTIQGGLQPLLLYLLFPPLAGGFLCLHSSLLLLLVALTTMPGSQSTLSPLPSSPSHTHTRYTPYQYHHFSYYLPSCPMWWPMTSHHPTRDLLAPGVGVGTTFLTYHVTGHVTDHVTLCGIIVPFV